MRISHLYFPAALFVLTAGPAGLPAQRKPGEPHWWEKEPLRILHLVTSTGQMAQFTPEELSARKRRHLYNAEHLEVMDLPMGMDDTGFFFSSKLASRKNEDYLARYLPDARKDGRRVLVYFNVHYYRREFGEKHADWMQIRENGQPLTGVYETGTDFCSNGPWREWVFAILRELCAYPIDGIFFDGPAFRADTCYCRRCQEKFRKTYGEPLPSKAQRRGKAFQKLLEFQAKSLAEFLLDARQIIHSVNPEIAFYMNGGVLGGNWATARLNRVLMPEQDLLGSEGGFIYGDLLRTPLWKPGVTARLLETQAGGKPRVIFAAAGHKPWTFSLLPEAELRLLYASSIANAANIWFCTWPSELDLPETNALIEMNRFLSRNGAYYMNTRSEARTALVWSDTTADFYAGPDATLIDAIRVPQPSEVGNLTAEFWGLADALVRQHAPFDVIDDFMLEHEDLRKYLLIFLPNVASMSDRTAERLKDYVRRGGNLFSTFETSAYDETGLLRKDFALAELFGATRAGGIVGPKRWDFMKPLSSSRLLDGLMKEFIPSPPYTVGARPKGGQALLQFTRPLAGPYDGVPKLSEDAALIVRDFGRGKSLYFAGDLGSALNTFRMVEFHRLIGNVLNSFSPSPVLIENAPASVEIVLRSQQEGKRQILHLVNVTGEMTRPIRKVVPLANVRITLAAPAEAKRVFTLVHPRQLIPERDARGRLQVVLPGMDEYEVIVIDQ